ncbi:glycosyltransferase [Lachnospiraceae bacterium 64-25]
MILKCTSFEQMSEEIIKQNRSVVIFGAGVIGTVTAPEVLKQQGLLARVRFYIDNNSKMWGTKLEVQGRRVEILPVDKLAQIKENISVIVAISRYAEALEQLSALPCGEQLVCYFMPMMCIHNFCSGISKGSPLLTKQPCIPKRIHYMWLGKKEIPLKLQKCIESWKQFCPDYEIIRWDESNYDLSQNSYMQEAYRAGAYGFVPDYARLDILYRYGGIYMDTDVEVIRSLDTLLYQEAFCGVEKWQVLNFGGCSGAAKGNQMILKFLKERERIPFLNADGSQNKNTCGYYDTKTAIKNGYELNGKTQNISGMNIYAYDYFHPYDYMSGQTLKTENTYTIHRFNGGWLDEKMKAANENAARKYEDLYQSAISNEIGWITTSRRR